VPLASRTDSSSGDKTEPLQVAHERHTTQATRCCGRYAPEGVNSQAGLEGTGVIAGRRRFRARYSSCRDIHDDELSKSDREQDRSTWSRRPITALENTSEAPIGSRSTRAARRPNRERGLARRRATATAPAPPRKAGFRVGDSRACSRGRFLMAKGRNGRDHAASTVLERRKNRRARPKCERLAAGQDRPQHGRAPRHPRVRGSDIQVVRHRRREVHDD